MSVKRPGSESSTILRAVEGCKTAPVPLPTAAHRAHRTTIELLKEMLEEAESGNVVEVVIVGYTREGHTMIMASPTTSYRNQIAGLEIAKFDILFAKQNEGGS